MDHIKLTLSMILSQAASGGVNIFYKLALANGMKVEILVVYRLIFATMFVAPIALVLERSTRPKFTWMIAILGLASGFLGPALSSNLYAESLVLTSTTFPAAMSNLTPALTLIMSICFGLERLDMRRRTGKAMVLGTAISIGGAMVLTMYRGCKITLWSTDVNLLNHYKSSANSHAEENLFLGAILALLSCISYVAWLVLQTKMIRIYPCYSTTALTCLNGAIVSGVYSLARERVWTDWKLGWNIRLFVVAYSGIIGSGFVFAVLAWGSLVKGPLYVSSFSPLGLIFVAVLGTLVLGEKLHLGSIIGSVFIIVGLYLVLWGKSKEIKIDLSCSKSTTREHRGDEATPSVANEV